MLNPYLFVWRIILARKDYGVCIGILSSTQQQYESQVQKLEIEYNFFFLGPESNNLNLPCSLKILLEKFRSST